MATLAPSTEDGRLYASSTAWATTRNYTNATGISKTSTAIINAISVAKYAARGGGYNYSISRTYFTFDTSGITTTVSEADLKIYGQSFNVADFFVVKSEHNDTLVVGDIDAITGWDASDTADGSGAGDQESRVTKYSGEITSFNTSAYNTISLNGQARLDIENDDSFKICLIESVHDLRDIVPTGYTNRTGVTFMEYTGTSRDPYLDYTAATVAVTENATFFGANF